jgi:hypothetical protein
MWVQGNIDQLLMKTTQEEGEVLQEEIGRHTSMRSSWEDEHEHLLKVNKHSIKKAQR